MLLDIAKFAALQAKPLKYNTVLSANPLRIP